MKPVPINHPSYIRRVGDHRIELVFLSTMERDEVYEQLLKDLEPQHNQQQQGEP